MSFYNLLAEKIILPFGEFIHGSGFMESLKEWRKTERLSSGEVDLIQHKRLAGLLNHAVKNIPFYKAYEQNKDQDPKLWIKAFPIMYKSTIKDHLNELILGNREKMVVEKSSGSSGIQGEIYMTRVESFRAIAAQAFLWEWSGYQLGSQILQLGITPQRSWLKNAKDFLLRTTYQQAFNIDKQKIRDTLCRIPNGSFFGGYASGLFAYALMAEELGIHNIRFTSVISWGDKMFPHYRKQIEKQFKTQVFDTYGCTEGMMIAGQCQFGSYHILTPHVYLELLDDQGNEVAPGQPGYVVATRLDAFSMPLIRYYLGDLAVRENPDKTCPCGKPFPMLRQVIGRDTDIIKTQTGKFLIVHFFTGIFEHIPEIRQFRVIQRTLDSIEIEFIPAAKELDPDIIAKIRKIIEEKLEEPLDIAFKQVDNIPPTPSGKPQIIQSFIV